MIEIRDVSGDPGADSARLCELRVADRTITTFTYSHDAQLEDVLQAARDAVMRRNYIMQFRGGKDEHNANTTRR